MKFYIDTQTSTHTTAATLTQAEKEYRQPLNASKADLLQSWETNPADGNGEWNVTIPGITASKLIDGLTIRIRIMTSYNGSYNTLNVNGLGKKLVYYRYNSPLTSHLPQYAEMLLTYRTAHTVGTTQYSGASSTSRSYGGVNYGTDGWVLDSSYSDGNTYDRILNSGEMRRAGKELTRYKICMLDANGLLQPISIGNSTSGNKTANTVPLQIPRMVYYASGTTIAAYGVVAQNTLYEDVPFDSRYTINATIGSYSDLYFVGTINENGYFVLDTTSATSYYKIVQQPSSASLANNTFIKGKYYLYVGCSRNTDNQVHLMPYHQLYICLDTNGKILTAAIPYAIGSDSKFVQTVTQGTESGKITLHGVTTSILYGRPETLVWKSTDTDLKLSVNSTDGSSVTSPAMPTFKVAWGGTGATTFASGKALIGNGTGAIQVRDIYTRTSVGTLEWSGATNEYLVTKGAIAYWNGAYTGTSSNIEYYKHGKFGTIGTANKDTWDKNFLLFTKDANTAATAPQLYTNGSVLGIGTPSVTSGYILEVNGKSKFRNDILAEKPVVMNDTLRVDKLATFKLGVNITGDITFPAANKFDWNDGTYRQRIVITDDSTADTAVFTFQQSSDAGSTYKDLFVIKDNGIVLADKFSGNGSLLENLNVDHVTAGTLLVKYGGTGVKTFTKNSVLFGNDANAIQAAGKVKCDASHLTVGQDTLNTSYALYINGNSYFKGDAELTGYFKMTNIADSNHTLSSCVGKRLAIWDGTSLKSITYTNLGNTMYTYYEKLNISLTLTETWKDVPGIDNTFLTETGSYIVQVYVNGGGTTGTTNMYQEYYTGFMSWFKDACNSSDADEIILHKAGHASNEHNIYLRTIRQTGSNTMKLQIKCSKTCTAAEKVSFRFRHML